MLNIYRNFLKKEPKSFSWEKQQKPLKKSKSQQVKYHIQQMHLIFQQGNCIIDFYLQLYGSLELFAL